MTKRKIKQEACIQVARLIDEALGSGWETEYLFPNEQDNEVFLDCLDEIMAEMHKRGGQRTPVDGNP